MCDENDFFDIGASWTNLDVFLSILLCSDNSPAFNTASNRPDLPDCVTLIKMIAQIALYNRQSSRNACH